MRAFTILILGLAFILPGIGTAAAEEPSAAPASASSVTGDLPGGEEAATMPALSVEVTATAGGGPAPASGKAAPPIEPGARLSLEQCIEIGLRQSPAIRSAEATAGAAGARLGQAKSAYYPQLSASGTYSQFSPYTDPTNGSQDLYQGTATLNQTFFDFGKTPNNVAIQRLSRNAASEDRRSVVAQVVYSVKQAYYRLLQTEKNRDVAVETVKLTEDQLAQARGFFEAGVKSKYDVTSAEVNVGNAKLGLIRAENAARIARVTLNNAMGVPDAPEFTIMDTLEFRPNGITLDDAVVRAYENRPDLRAQQSRREASRKAVSLARTGHLPVLSGTASYTRADSEYPPEKSGWSAGVTLTMPLFNGFLTSNQVKEAKQNLYAAQANEETLRQAILLDVQQAFLSLHEAEDSVGVAKLTVQQAQENFDIANGRYNAGVGSPLDVTNALVGLANAKTNYIAALANFKIAEAALLKAMGE
jgi:outer membrane protein TolC